MTRPFRGFLLYALALSIAFAATPAFSQTQSTEAPPPRQHRVQGPGEDCNLSKFCGVPYVYVPPAEPPSPALTGKLGCAAAAPNW